MRRLGSFALFVVVTWACVPGGPGGRPEELAHAAHRSVEREILETWETYVRSKGGRFRAGASTPSRYWLEEEQEKWSVYDLAGFYLPTGARPTVVDVSRSAGGEYQILTRFDLEGPSKTETGWPSTTYVTVYALRVDEEWRFGNALPRTTRDWQREEVGGIRYVTHPRLSFDRSRAHAAVAFVDSLAWSLSLPAPTPVDYYQTPSAREAFRSLGITFPQEVGPEEIGETVGLAQPINGIVVVGNPALESCTGTNWPTWS